MKKKIFICLLVCLIAGLFFISFKNKSKNNSSDNTYYTTTTISREECLAKFGTWNEDENICALRNRQ